MGELGEGLDRILTAHRGREKAAQDARDEQKAATNQARQDYDRIEREVILPTLEAAAQGLTEREIAARAAALPDSYTMRSVTLEIGVYERPTGATKSAASLTVGYDDEKQNVYSSQHVSSSATRAPTGTTRPLDEVTAEWLETLVLEVVGRQYLDT